MSTTSDALPGPTAAHFDTASPAEEYDSAVELEQVNAVARTSDTTTGEGRFLLDLVVIALTQLKLRMALVGILLALVLLVSVGINFFLLSRTPETLIIERTAEGDRVIGNNRTGAETSGLKHMSDQPGDGDKKHLTRKWAESQYQMDANPEIRAAEFAKGLRMMEERAGKAWVQKLKEQRTLERQRTEGWQTLWRPQLVEVDRVDPSKVRVVGKLDITKTRVPGAPRESRQLMFVVETGPADKRMDNNANTGFMVLDILDMRDIVDPTAASGSTPSAAAHASGPQPSVP